MFVYNYDVIVLMGEYSKTPNLRQKSQTNPVLILKSQKCPHAFFKILKEPRTFKNCSKTPKLFNKFSKVPSASFFTRTWFTCLEIINHNRIAFVSIPRHRWLPTKAIDCGLVRRTWYVRALSASFGNHLLSGRTDSPQNAFGHIA